MSRGKADSGAKPVNFDADARVEERQKGIIKVGGKVFHPRKKSGKLMKDLIGMGPEKEPDENEPLTKAESQENVTLVYRQLSALLVEDDGEGGPKRDEDGLVIADPDFLEDELDFDDAQELVNKLMPSREEREQGKPERGD